MTLDTDGLSTRLRALSVDRHRQRLLVTRLTGSGQEGDLSEPVNADGHGRVRHFRRATSRGWPDNPLPLDPACGALGLDSRDTLTAQVFQNAACNWRCWYCFVPFDLLGANPRLASWVTADQLVDWYLRMPERPPVIDLSGGQPDLVPEWTAWTARALRDRGLDDQVYLWVDDNLSNDYFWRYLDDADRATLAGYRCYGRVGCFKGYDETSFVFNTGAAPELFARQFTLMRRHLADGTDCYGYATFTAPTTDDPAPAMTRFVDRLQDVDENLPLRVVPLEVEVWGPVGPRMRSQHELALLHQHEAVRAWQHELDRRFTPAQRAVPVHQVGVARR